MGDKNKTNVRVLRVARVAKCAPSHEKAAAMEKKLADRAARFAGGTAQKVAKRAPSHKDMDDRAAGAGAQKSILVIGAGLSGALAAWRIWERLLCRVVVFAKVSNLHTHAEVVYWWWWGGALYR